MESETDEIRRRPRRGSSGYISFVTGQNNSQAPTQGVEDVREIVPSEAQLDESIEVVLKTEVEPKLDADDGAALDQYLRKCIICSPPPSDFTC